MPMGSKWDSKRKWDLVDVIVNVIAAIILIALAIQTNT